jgi:hypothetical protein
MTAADISALAHHLFETHGTKAIAEAAHKAVSFETAGDQEQAKLWRSVEATLREMRGAKET